MYDGVIVHVEDIQRQRMKKCVDGDEKGIGIMMHRNRHQDCVVLASLFFTQINR
jgi:hypothetical protein